jgi:hypothetical protein
MSSIGNLIFDMKNGDIDKAIMIEKFEFFREKKNFDGADPFQFHEALSSSNKLAFRKYIVYELDGDLDGLSTDDFRALLKFLDFTCINLHQSYKNNLPRFRRFLHEHRANKSLMIETIPIHMNSNYICGRIDNDKGPSDLINMWCVYLGIDISLRWSEKYRIFREGNTLLHQFLTAVCLSNGVACKADDVAAVAMYAKNWQENKCALSLGRLASYKTNDIAIPVDIITELTKEWEKNRSSICLTRLANRYYYYNANKTMARELWKQGWELNRSYHCLCEYIDCLTRGIGGPTDVDEATRLRVIYDGLITE